MRRRSASTTSGTISPVPDASASVPQWTPTTRELDDLEVLLNGALAPEVSGFADPGTSVGWPVTLTVTAEAAAAAEAAGAIDLIDPEGAPLARLTVLSTYAAGDRTGLVGPVERLAHNEFGPFRRLYRSPQEVHAGRPQSELLAVPVRGPLSSAELDEIRTTAGQGGLTPLLIALTGEGMPLATSAPGLVRMALAATAELADLQADVVAVSLPDHGTHTDPMVGAVAAAYATASTATYGSATDDLPKAIAEIASHERPPRDEQGVVIFFTGLSGSGKSTLARALVDAILEQGERTVTSLDGDVVRHHLSKGLGFSREDRETNITRIGFVAAEIARHGGVAICSPIAPFEATRATVRAMVERAGGGFVLIHVATPLEECERRDRKGLYAKARRGEIPDFTGISSPYEVPTDSSLKIDTTDRDIAECLEELTQALVAEGWLRA